MNKGKTTTSETLVDSRWVKLRKDSVDLPNGQYIGATVESSAKLTNTIHIFFANHCRKVCEQHLDSTEELDVLVVPLEQAVDMVMSNEICCNSSVHGIFWVARRLGV